MATQEVIHTHEGTSAGGMGFLLGVILLLATLFLFFYYGLPMIQQAASGPTINIPRQVDVNVNQTK
jgi:hypothetical protein